MFYKMQSNNYSSIKELFRSIDYTLEIETIMKKQTGQIFIDNKKQPQTACIFSNKHNFYIAGRSNNSEFNDALSKYIINDVCPSMRMTDYLDFNIHYGNNGLWEDVLKTMFEKHYVSSINRRYYKFDKDRANLNIELPEGFILKKIDEELLKRKDLKNIEEIIEWISTEGWLNQQDFLQNGFGFCIIDGQNIVSWCLTDFVIGNRCEIGIETDEDYRRKGFAPIAVSACIKYCLSNGIEDIGWHCFESNIGSKKTAEKVGFRLAKKYAPIFGWFNSFDNYLVQAYLCYGDKNYLQAAKLYEKAFELTDIDKQAVKVSRICNKNNQFKFYYNAARAYAHCGNVDLSLSKLRLSFDMGLSKDMVLEEDVFKVLSNIEEFNKLLDEIS